MDLGLTDKVAFIAGSSRGIGLAVARGFLREGAKVVVTGREAAPLDHARELLAADAGAGRVRAVQGDMTSPEDIQRAFGAAIDAFGGLDAVIANVGSGTGPAGWDLSCHDWESALRVNLLGAMALATAAVPHLAPRRGSLTFIASITGREAMRAPVPYGAAKAALLSASKGLARLLGPQGVRVNAVAPGNILFPGGAWERKLAARREAFEQYIRDEVPLGRFGAPEEIADAVVFLASSRASFVTGACLVVDGGQTRSYL